ncbi:Crp/Fnr family transcriptional regulator [Pseudomonadota bacterium]
MDVQSLKMNELRKTSLFSGLNDTQLELALKNLQRQEFKPGEMLFSQGQTAKYFFWLRSGLVKLYRLSPAGEEKIIEIIRPGQTFAEAIMFNKSTGKFPVNAQIIEEGEIWSFSNSDFKALLENSPESCFRVMAKMSQRLHQLINEIDRLTLQTATDRVINYLLQHRTEGSAEIQLVTSKQTLASQLSIKPETLSRTFSRLNKEGLIKIEGNVIKLLDLDTLRERAEV